MGARRLGSAVTMTDRGQTTTGRVEGSPGGSAGRAAWVEPADRRVGILGGTFDPVHYGHLVIAEQVREALELDRVLFVPAAMPPHKLDEPVTSAVARVTMVELAIAELSST